MKLILLVFAGIFALSKSEPLSKWENANRLDQCGSIYHSKVYKGLPANQSSAPWSLLLKKHNLNSCTGTLVSSRHVLTATHCFTHLDLVGWDLVVKDRKNCHSGHYFLNDRRILDAMELYSDSKKVAEIKSVILLNACLMKTLIGGQKNNHVYEDFAIVELKTNMKFTKTLQPACVAPPGPRVPYGLKLHYFGFGLNPVTDTTGNLLYEQIQTIPSKLAHLNSYFFMAADPNEFRIACPGDSGGGAMGTEGDKVTLIGVLSQSNCKGFIHGDDPMEIYSSMAYYAKQVCTYAGICTPGKKRLN